MSTTVLPSTSPTGSKTTFPEMSCSTVQLSKNSFRGKSARSNGIIYPKNGANGKRSPSPESKRSSGTGQRWYTTLNPSNTLIRRDEIQKILKKGNITIPIKDLSVWQRAFVHKSYIVKDTKQSSDGDDSSSSGNTSPSRSPRSTESGSPVSRDGARSPPASQTMVPLQGSSNERLEWLGDAQLQAAVTQYLFKRYPDKDEGFLTKLRSKLVKTKNLSFLAKKIGLDPYLIISYHVEFGCQGRINKRILENTFEAFIGAMYTDFSNLKEVPNYAYGYEVVRRFVVTLIEKYNDIVEMILKDDNYKDSLMWFFQKNFSGAYPIYHKEKFENEYFYVFVKEPNSEKVVGRGSARSKKQAEQKAAKNALHYYAKLNMTQAPQ